MKTFQILNGENRFYVYSHKLVDGKIKGRKDALVR